MNAYLISEEVLLEVLKTQMDMQEGHVELNELLDSIHTLCTILASPPAEPVAWCQSTEDEVLPEAGFSWTATALHDIPLFRKES